MKEHCAPSSNRMFATALWLAKDTVLIAVFSRQAVSPVLWLFKIDVGVAGVSVAWIGCPLGVLGVCSRVSLLGGFWGLHKLVWCLRVHVLHRYFDLHWDTLWWPRQLKHKFACLTIANCFSGSVNTSH